MKQILSYNAVIRSKLEEFLETKKAAANPAIPWQADFLGRLLPFATTGKLLRGSLVCFSYEALGDKPVTDSVIRAAMAVELTHSALLIHDDIMDQDALRRGKPSMHQQYQSLAEKENLADAAHFGASIAIGGGDLALFLDFELLAGCPAEVVQLFTDQLVTTCAGQMQDLYLEAGEDMPPKDAIYELMETKTASYTMALPLALGAALAGQTDEVLEQLRIIGIKAGTIFQVRDDELGVMGDSGQTGKPVGSDITEGKKTLVYYYLLRQCDAGERKKLQAIFGNPDATADNIALVRELIKKHDITNLLNNEISSLERQALAHIDGFVAPEKAKTELIALVQFCGNRHS
jgi:geranylgeranyl diphosphate synthase type I